MVLSEKELKIEFIKSMNKEWKDLKKRGNLLPQIGTCYEYILSNLMLRQATSSLIGRRFSFTDVIGQKLKLEEMLGQTQEIHPGASYHVMPIRLFKELIEAFCALISDFEREKMQEDESYGYVFHFTIDHVSVIPAIQFINGKLYYALHFKIDVVKTELINSSDVFSNGTGYHILDNKMSFSIKRSYRNIRELMLNLIADNLYVSKDVYPVTKQTIDQVYDKAFEERKGWKEAILEKPLLFSGVHDQQLWKIPENKTFSSYDVDMYILKGMFYLLDTYLDPINATPAEKERVKKLLQTTKEEEEMYQEL